MSFASDEDELDVLLGTPDEVLVGGSRLGVR